MFDIIDTIKNMKKKTFSIIDPLETKQLFDNLYSIKDSDSNYFIYKKNNSVIAIDSGYKDSPTREMEENKIPINSSDVNSVFLTHIDSDHAGCLYSNKPIFKNSTIYLHKNEIDHLIKKVERVKFKVLKINHKLEVKREIKYLYNNNPIYVGDIKVQPVLTAGHTLGHTCYFVDDKYLFVGDSLVLKNGFGYRFFDLLGFNNKQNSQSLLKLKEIAIEKGAKYIITSHTGVSNSISKAFKYCEKEYSVK